ncbi:hypothetical protein STVIR_0178 [Streptomyces viridochromogenes Tue57]|uniref:Uncharacterized protein n=1 Tax=Streptomyces viridochromogenes Tue57 TaxID=1160705 RepID=L8PML4_STRVR|nr:hypothetical protein STVIR_0178 [Streptomyces viridochromogenes Tue57]
MHDQQGRHTPNPAVAPPIGANRGPGPLSPRRRAHGSRAERVAATRLPAGPGGSPQRRPGGIRTARTGRSTVNTSLTRAQRLGPHPAEYTR